MTTARSPYRFLIMAALLSALLLAGLLAAVTWTGEAGAGTGPRVTWHAGGTAAGDDNTNWD